MKLVNVKGGNTVLEIKVATKGREILIIKIDMAGTAVVQELIINSVLMAEIMKQGSIVSAVVVVVMRYCAKIAEPHSYGD